MKRNPAENPKRGFTLPELAVVMLIIGLLLSFVLVASLESAERARARATQGLLAKLDTAVNDRLQALSTQTVEPNEVQKWMAASPRTPDPNNPPLKFWTDNPQRAQIIALADLIKAEMPDTFFIQIDVNSPPPPGAPGPIYPFNFAARPYFASLRGEPIAPPFPNPEPAWRYVLPYGQNIHAFFAADVPIGLRDPEPTNPQEIKTFTAGIGIYGATYGAAAGLYKNLGYLPAGYDGADNNGDGWVDEWAEGVNATNHAEVVANLQRHNQRTARAEMLYALLVEGKGLAGSIFTSTDFSANEVADTDGDGLPEFVDAWGHPLQFFRWPTHYSSEAQYGAVNPDGYDGIDSPTPDASGVPVLDNNVDDYFELSWYPAPFARREQNPLDPGGLLLSFDWWAAYTGGGQPTRHPALNPISDSGPAIPNFNRRALLYMHLYHSLVEPVSDPGASATGGVEPYMWDRNGYLLRRAFMVKPLILSGGPDETPGVPLLTDALPAGMPDGVLDSFTIPDGLAPVPINSNSPGAPTADDIAANIVLIEGQAAQLHPARNPGPGATNLYQQPPWGQAFNAACRAMRDAGLDDLTNHNMLAPGGGSAR